MQFLINRELRNLIRDAQSSFTEAFRDGQLDVQVEVTLPFNADAGDLSNEKGGEPSRSYCDVIVVRVISALNEDEFGRAIKALKYMHETMLTPFHARTLLLNKVSHVRFIWPEGPNRARFQMFRTKDFINGPPPDTLGA